MRIPFWKVESVGNDFPLVKIEDVVASLPEVNPPSLDWALSDLAARMSDRKFGVGGDGLLAVAMEEGDVRLRMFNPDGTEDFCGNGLRCAALFAYRQGWVPKEFSIRHRERVVPTVVQEDGIVRTTIGTASYESEDVPVVGGPYFDTTVWSGMDTGMPMSLSGSILSTGSTHTIIPTYALPDDDSFRSVSSKIENDPKFPERTSVIWMKEIAPDHISIRIWERGAGETLGCGTGSSAAAVDYLRRKGRGGTVTVDNPGGTLKVSMTSWDAPITMEGKPEIVYSGFYGVGAPAESLNTAPAAPPQSAPSTMSHLRG